MRKLEDKTTGLTWLIPEVAEMVYDNPVYTAEDASLLEDFRRELNECKSKNISKFVTGNCNGLGDFMQWAIMGKKSPCYGFEDGKLVTTAVFSPNNKLSKIQQLRDYIAHCESNPHVFGCGMDGYLSYRKAKSIMQNRNDSNNADIDYLVVVPNAQGHGVGTRAVYSITHNLGFFAPENPIETITSQIHMKNTASKIVFARNGFEQYGLETDIDYNPFEEHIKTI